MQTLREGNYRSARHAGNMTMRVKINNSAVAVLIFLSDASILSEQHTALSAILGLWGILLLGKLDQLSEDGDLSTLGMQGSQQLLFKSSHTPYLTFHSFFLWETHIPPSFITLPPLHSQKAAITGQPPLKPCCLNKTEKNHCCITIHANDAMPIYNYRFSSYF